MTTKELLADLPRIARQIAIDLTPPTPPHEYTPARGYSSAVMKIVEQHLAPLKDHLLEVNRATASMNINHEAILNDMGTLLRLLKLGDHARPASPHQVMLDEIIPAIAALVSPLETDADTLKFTRNVVNSYPRLTPHEREVLYLAILKIVESRERYLYHLSSEVFFTTGPGSEQIARERLRQVQEEGHSLDVDDRYTTQQLSSAAVSYLVYQVHRKLKWQHSDAQEIALDWWPWDRSTHGSFKPDPENPLHNLIRAGALIAAEIDRLTRAQQLDKKVDS